MRARRVFCAVLTCGACLLSPTAARAQAADNWEVNLAPLYFWASELDGEVSVNRVTAPMFMSFGDAVDHLSGIFTFHVEARKGRWGVLSDLSFVSLSTQAQFTVPGLLPSAPNRTITGDFELDNTIFEAGASYLVVPAREFSVIGGLRTYGMSPKITFATNAGQVAPVDSSRTSVNVFAGFLFRPRLSEKWFLVTRGDVGGGEGFTWSGTAAVQFQMTKLAGVMFGYRALGIDAGDVASRTQLAAGSDAAELGYDMTHYGPIVAMNLRWGTK